MKLKYIISRIPVQGGNIRYYVNIYKGSIPYCNFRCTYPVGTISPVFKAIKHCLKNILKYATIEDCAKTMSESDFLKHYIRQCYLSAFGEYKGRKEEKKIDAGMLSNVANNGVDIFDEINAPIQSPVN